MNKKKKETILISSVVGFISYLFVILWYIHLALVMEENPKLEFIDALNLSFDDLFTRPFTIFPLPNDIFSKILLYTLLCGLLIFALVVGVIFGLIGILKFAVSHANEDGPAQQKAAMMMATAVVLGILGGTKFLGIDFASWLG